MRLREASLLWYRSVDHLEFGVKPFTVLYGRNNSGKTNILEAIYGVLAPAELDAERADHTLPRGLRGSDQGSPPLGALIVELEAGASFDDEVLALRRSDGAPEDGSVLLPASQVAFIGDYDSAWLTFHDPRDYFRHVQHGSNLPHYYRDHGGQAWRDRFEATLVESGPLPLPLFLDWEIDDIETRVGNMLMDSLFQPKWAVYPVLEEVKAVESGQMWRIRHDVQDYLELFSGLATGFLPDFIGGSIQARFKMPTTWQARPSLTLGYCGRQSVAERSLDAIGDLGRGSSRWVAVAIQIALHLLVHSDYSARAELGERDFSGQVLFLDEPEAHLHPLAVKSIVRWCRRMVERGFNVIVASHHEEFLRHSGPEVAHVHITRSGDPTMTRARTLLASATPLLQDVAREIGMHPATVLSLHRGILFVEGPLDHAVLDEYASAALEAAGVTIVPIHGTRNMEGLIDAELTPRLGIKAGVLTDATDPDTMGQRSNKKRSREEKWVTRLIKSYTDKGLPPPTSFGVLEDDLLFALPAQGVRKCYPDSASNFPGWLQMREECRAALGKGPSDSVDWKLYAEQHYGLPLTTADGVRSLVHTLDLADVEFPSIRRVIDQIVAWATE
jgi:energy-coupling factor transporter ATP-binding protein EcfA2